MGGVLTATLWQNNRLTFDKVIFDGSPLVSYNKLMKGFMKKFHCENALFNPKIMIVELDKIFDK